MIKKTIYYLVLSVLLLVISYTGYLWITYIDTTIKSGGGYGFSVGDSKLITYRKAPEALLKIKVYPSSLVFFEINADNFLAEKLSVEPGNSILIEAILSEGGYKNFKRLTQWDFYINGSYFNKLTLKFCDDKLCEIYRHRQYFELP